MGWHTYSNCLVLGKIHIFCDFTLLDLVCRWLPFSQEEGVGNDQGILAERFLFLWFLRYSKVSRVITFLVYLKQWHQRCSYQAQPVASGLGQSLSAYGTRRIFQNHSWSCNSCLLSLSCHPAPSYPNGLRTSPQLCACLLSHCLSRGLLGNLSTYFPYKVWTYYTSFNPSGSQTPGNNLAAQDEQLLTPGRTQSRTRQEMAVVYYLAQLRRIDYIVTMPRLIQTKDYNVKTSPNKNT